MLCGGQSECQHCNYDKTQTTIIRPDKSAALERTHNLLQLAKRASKAYDSQEELCLKTDLC